MKTFALMAVAGLALGACTSVDSAHAPSFGQSVQAMQHTQSDAAAVSSADPEGGGASGALAQTRYKTGRTTPLLATSTSTANPSSSNQP